MSFQPSPQQADFFNWIKTGKGSCILEAVAGAGKTTTLIEALKLMQGRIFFGAYNKKIAEEIQARAPKKDNLFISTMHAAGFGAWRKACSGANLKVDANKCRDLFDTFEEKYHRLAAPVLALVSFAKQAGIGLANSIDDDSQWYALIEHFDIDTQEDDAEVVKLAKQLLKQSIDLDAKIIDFDDMIYASLIHKAKFYEYDWVLVDECQDTNATRRALALAMLKRGGRLVGVGDRYQAIYGFCHPAGTKVLTPLGHLAIENLRVGDPVIVSHTDGQVQGRKCGNEVLETHAYHHSGMLFTLSLGNKKVEMTPHHKVPAQLNPIANYYTYIMRRDGVYRAGHCKAFTAQSGEFMFTFRAKTEGADAGWLLAAHEDKQSAIEAEKRLLQRIKGFSFAKLTENDMAELPTEETEALKILGEHGRMVNFPLWSRKHNHRISRNAAFITEACNLMEGMLMTYFPNHRPLSRQKFTWEPISISARPFAGTVYGITVRPAYAREGYKTHPLYFAGDNILVHNTGADADAIDLLGKSVSAIQMPLTVTYRCPKAVVEVAQRYVDHITTHPSAPQGLVTKLDKDTDLTKLAVPGDAILCRFNRPIMELVYRFIANGVPAKVEGREIGNQLKTLARRWKWHTYSTLSDKLNEYAERELTKFRAKGKETQAANIEDRVQCLQVIIRRCQEIDPNASSAIDRVCQEINSLFGDNVDGKFVLLSSIHRSKGREWERVYYIQGSSKHARRDWEILAEKCLKYVAVTRAKSELILVPGPAKKG